MSFIDIKKNKAEFTHSVLACFSRIALQFLLITLIEENQGK